MKKQRLLGIIYEPGNFQSMRMICEAGGQSGAFDMILWSPYALPEGDRYRQEAATIGGVYIEENTAAGALANIHGPLSGWLTGKPARLPVRLDQNERKALVRSSAIDSVLAALDTTERTSALRAADVCERRAHFCEDWLVRLGIDVIMFAEDNVERDSFAWIAAAKRRGVRSVVSSYGALSAREAEVAYAHSGPHQVARNHIDLVQKYLGRWLRQGEGYAITRLPFAEMLGRELFGLTPFDPWLVNSNGVDRIALESRAMFDIYTNFGFHHRQLAAIGYPLHDRLAIVRRQRKERRVALARKHGFDPTNPLIVVAMPPDQLDSRPSPFERYDSLLKAFSVAPSQLTGSAVVVSPHPNMTAEEKDRLVAIGGKLEDMSVAELLPLADLYIACVSSTIKWALGLGIPVIDFDCYGYNYPDYQDLPQVRSVDTVAEFSVALADWFDNDKKSVFQQAAIDGSSVWGDIDGHALERLLALCLAEN